MKKLIFLPLLPFLVTACATLGSVARPVPPEVTLREVSLQGMDFSRAELVAEFHVSNPNAVAVDLSGFTWALLVEGEPFLSGEQREGIRIEARGESTVEVPLTVAFREALHVARATTEATMGAQQLAYAVELVVMLDVPVLGARAVPLRHEGTLPVPVLPALSVNSLRLDSIGLTGAELSLLITLENPNVFGVALQELSYRFSVHDRTWIEGALPAAVHIAPDQEQELAIPIRLRFLEVGRGVYQLITRGPQLEYRLEAGALVRPDFELLPTVEIRPVLTGAIPISR